jgi:hypothetical protein
MRCFFHPANEAVGVCKNCSRGICSQCAAVVEDSLACKGRCEQKVATLNQLLARAPQAHQINVRSAQRSGLTIAFMGLMIAAMGGMIIKSAVNESGKTLGFLSLGLGGLLLLSGIFALVSARKFHNSAQSADFEMQGKSSS